MQCLVNNLCCFKLSHLLNMNMSAKFQIDEWSLSYFIFDLFREVALQQKLLSRGPPKFATFCAVSRLFWKRLTDERFLTKENECI